MSSTTLRSERGQAIVLIVLAVVALLGFAALAVDGSMMLSDRRFAQSASDAACMSGAANAAQQIEKKGLTWDNWSCVSSEIDKVAASARNAAVSYAKVNNVSIDQDISDHNGVITECKVSSLNGLPLKYMDVKTEVTQETRTAFMHFVFKGVGKNTVTSVGRVWPRSPLAYGYAIVALNPDDCKGMNTGVELHGTADVIVEKGGVFTNGCLRGVGTQKISVSNSSIHYRSEFINSGNSNFTPAPQKIDYQMSPNDYAITEPNCTDSEAHRVRGKDLRGELEPGLWCVDGDATINAGDTLTGDGVTIVMMDGRLHIDGHAEVKLSAPTVTTDVWPAIPGIVIYAPPSTNYRDVNKNGILLNGNSTSYFTGTILAPALDVYINGTGSSWAYNAQIIGWNVQVGGTADTYVNYNGKNIYTRPTMVDLYR
jgi:hypothetical protein